MKLGYKVLPLLVFPYLGGELNKLRTQLEDMGVEWDSMEAKPKKKCKKIHIFQLSTTLICFTMDKLII